MCLFLALARPGLGGFKVALGAMAGLRRQWATELGQHDIRVIILKTDGIPEHIPDNDPMKETWTLSRPSWPPTSHRR